MFAKDNENKNIFKMQRNSISVDVKLHSLILILYNINLLLNIHLDINQDFTLYKAAYCNNKLYLTINSCTTYWCPL